MYLGCGFGAYFRVFVCMVFRFFFVFVCMVYFCLNFVEYYLVFTDWLVIRVWDGMGWERWEGLLG